MAGRKFAVTRFEGRAYTHRPLFSVAEKALKRAQGDAHDWQARLTATLFAAIAIEAYINLLIEQLDKSVFAKERDFFTRRNGYPGIRGKIRWALAQLKGKRPLMAA